MGAVMQHLKPGIVVGPAVAGVGLEHKLQVGEAGIAERLGEPDHGGGLDLRLAREFGDAAEGDLLRMVDREIGHLHKPLRQTVPAFQDQRPQFAEIARRGGRVDIRGGQGRLILGVLRRQRHLAVFHAHPFSPVDNKYPKWNISSRYSDKK